MSKTDDISGGFSSIPRSDLKIGGDELVKTQDSSKIQQRLDPILNSGNTGHASKDIEMSQTGTVSQSCVSNKSELMGQEVVKPSSMKLDLNKNVVVKRNEADSVTQKRNGLDLNSTCLNDDVSSVCSSRRREKSSYSECGSNTVTVEEKDPMKLWKAMKENGFLSNPHGGISGTSSSCIVSSSHGGIPAPRKRGRKSNKNNNNNNSNNDAAMVKKRKIEIARKEEVDRFARLAAPSGLLNELNPGIINHVRNKKQVLSIIENIVKSDKESGNYYSMRHSYGKNMEDVNTTEASMRYYEDKFANSEENNTIGSENVSSLSSEDSAVDLNCASVLTVKAATVASQWLELLHQDIKGRVSALRRSKKRVRQVVTTELPFLIKKEFSTDADQENDPNLLLNKASSASNVDSSPSNVDNHRKRWMALFNQLDHTLSEEERQLESWLNQVRELQSHCDQGLQHLSLSSGQNFLQLGMPLDSRATDALISDKDLVVKAAAACMYATCDFIASKENNITCS